MVFLVLLCLISNASAKDNADERHYRIQNDPNNPIVAYHCGDMNHTCYHKFFHGEYIINSNLHHPDISHESKEIKEYKRKALKSRCREPERTHQDKIKNSEMVEYLRNTSLDTDARRSIIRRNQTVFPRGV